MTGPMPLCHQSALWLGILKPLQLSHGGRRQPMCDPEGCSTVWGAVGGGDPTPLRKGGATPPPFVDPNLAPFPSSAQTHKANKTHCDWSYFMIVLLHCSTFIAVLNVALSSPKGLPFPLSQTTDIYIEKRSEGRGLKHRNHPPTRHVPSCRYSWGEHASLAGLLAIL